MKPQSVVFCVALIFLLLKTEELQALDRHQIALECIATVGIDKKVVDEAKEKAKTGEVTQNSVKFKEFLSCSYKKQGYQNEKGEILMENMKKFLENFYSTSDLQQLDACPSSNTLNSTNHAENAYQALKCVLGKLTNMTEVNNE